MENIPTQETSPNHANSIAFIDPAMLETRPIDEFNMGLDADPSTFVSRCIAAQDFADYLTDTDTDAENSVLPRNRRWVWYCKLRTCPKYCSTWICKSNFLLHLYETPEHRGGVDRERRRQFVKCCREETAYDLSEPKKRPPQDDDTNGPA